MTTPYSDYRRALAQLRDLPARATEEREIAQREHAQAIAVAAAAESQIDAATADALQAIEAQLAAARTALEPLGRSNLVPPRIRSSGRTSTATREDVAAAQSALAGAVNRVREAVQAEIAHIVAGNERLARQAADRERRARAEATRRAATVARRQRLIRIGLVAVPVIVVIVLGLIVAL